MHRFAMPALCSLLIVAAPACGDGGSDRGDTDSGDTVGPPPAGCEGSIAFPDPALDACIRESIGRPSGDISYGDISVLVDLYCRSAGISSLEGVQCARGLQGVFLNSSVVTDLQPLASLPSLAEIELANNAVSDISPLAGVQTLEHLDLMANAVADLSPLAGLTSMSWLSVDSNNVSDLAPLVANSGLATGDWVSATLNPIDCAAQAGNIDSLRARGVDLYTDCD